MALFRQRSVADEEGFVGGIDDLGREGLEAVDDLDAIDLGEKPVDESQVAAGDTDDRCDGGRMRYTAIGRRGRGT